MRKLGKAVDLTVGNPAKLILTFAIPIFLCNALQILYSLIDTKIVGYALGENALAAVGSASPLQSLLVGFLSGTTTGFSIIIARYFGAEKKQDVKKSFMSAILLGMGLTLLLVILLAIFLKPILHLLNVPDEQFPRTYIFMFIVLWGMLATAMYNILAASLRAIGDSITPLIYLFVSVVLNIGLNFLFIMGIGMDVEGSALSTVLAQVISVILCVIYIRKKYPIFHLNRQYWMIDGKMLLQLLKAGLSMGAMNSLVWFGTLALQCAINTLGTSIIVAHTAARKMTEILFLPLIALGNAMATFTGQNLGAGKYDRIRKTMFLTLGICWIWDVCTILICIFASAPIIRFIASTANTDVIYWGSTYLRVDTLFYFVSTPITIIRNTMQGYGDHVTPIISSGIEMVGKMVIAFLLVPILHYWGVIWAEPIIWILMLIPLVVQAARNPILKKSGKA